jgi:chromosome segregation ATPase
MPRKKAPQTALGPPPSVEGMRETAAVEPTSPMPGEELDFGRLLVTFQKEIEGTLAGFQTSIVSQQQSAAAKVAEMQGEVRQLSSEVETMRRVFSDLQDTARRTTAEMVELLKKSHQEAAKASEAAQVYAKLSDARPDLLRRIEQTNVAVAGYRTEVKQMDGLLEALSKRLDTFGDISAGYQESRASLERLSAVVHSTRTKPLDGDARR